MPNHSQAPADTTDGDTPDGGAAHGAPIRVGVWLGVGLAAALLCVSIVYGAALAVGGLIVKPLRVTAAVTDAAALPAIPTTRSVTIPTIRAPATLTVTLAPTAASDTSSAAVTGTATPAATASAVPSLTPTLVVSASTTERQLRIFHALWNNVNRYYVYPDFNGVDWVAVRTTTDQRIQAGISDEAFYDLMRAVVDGLKDNHSSFLSPQEAQQEEEEYRGDAQYVGVGIISEINTVRRYAYVLQVLPNSPAEAAGIRAHDHVLTINGQPSVNGDEISQMALLRGPVSSTVTLSVRSPGAEPREVVVTRTNLSTSAPVEYHLLPGRRRIGYMQIPTLFEQDVSEQVRTALTALMQGGRLEGLIVDIRINGGGEYQILMQTLGFFTQGRVGELVDRAGVVAPLVVNAHQVGNSQSVPLLILIRGSTESYAEVFAGVLRARGRAKLVGETTAGNIETLRAHRFEDGSVAWLAEETLHLSNGSNWEGKGLQPDVGVNLAWDEYSADNDPVIAAAVKSLNAGH